MVFSTVCKQLMAVVFLLMVRAGYAQNFVLPNAYAHNDYWNKRPLLDALENGFTYIEADVFLRNGQLIVAHILPCFKKKKTLEELYLKPLLTYLEKNGRRHNAAGTEQAPITLMIDIKSGANKTYAALAALLEKYQSILSGYKDGQIISGNVTVVITGHKPVDLINHKDNRLVFMDEDLKLAGTDSTLNIYPIASCKYSSIISWKGKGVISAQDVQKLSAYVAQAHKNGRKVRLWGSPEKKVVWSVLLKYNVDLINTDRIKSLRKFLLADQLLWVTKRG